MSSAERVVVPLNNMCSTKWAMPPRSAVSCRDPRVSQTPILIERTWVIFSVRRRRPLSRTSLTIGELDKWSSQQECFHQAGDMPQSLDTEGITSSYCHYNTGRPDGARDSGRSSVGSLTC